MQYIKLKSYRIIVKDRGVYYAIQSPKTKMFICMECSDIVDYCWNESKVISEDGRIEFGDLNIGVENNNFNKWMLKSVAICCGKDIAKNFNIPEFPLDSL